MFKYLFFLSSVLVTNLLMAQCPIGQSRIKVIINPDNYPAEITWDITANGSIIVSGNAAGGQICVPNNQCVSVNLHDAANDGIWAPGSFYIVLNSDTVAFGVGVGNTGTYTSGFSINLLCPPGTACNNAIPANLGSNASTFANEYYTFTPAVTGMYQISTIGLSTCNTTFWIYASCNGNTTNITNIGTLFYNDDFNATTQSQIDGIFEAGTTYILRIATAAPCNGSDFTISYTGPVVGCMDPLSCNYSPLATVSNNNCLYFPNPLCPNAPDLTIDQQRLLSTLQIRTEQATNCQVIEGCMTGYGNRTVLAFDTRIDNIGNTDYYIGNPGNHPEQFSFQNCHGHAHYEGYADYVLYKDDGTSIPIGHKNGFCVLDLTCPAGIPAQYGCSNMGITAGCGDIYNAGLDCQWIDITDVDTGSYTMAVKVNWDQSPDALGRVESSFTNNWAQVCIRITADVNGQKGYVVLPNCQPYTDCSGVAYGNAVVDCQGACGGSAMRGDLDISGSLTTIDAQLYQTGILANTLPSTTCRDLSNDGLITVWDAALELNCALNGAPNNQFCDFPNTVEQLTQITEIGYLDINTSENYIDVYIRNAQAKVGSYEFLTSGFTIASAENMIPSTIYGATPAFNPSTGKVYCISYLDSMIPKHITPTKLVRLYYSAITNPSAICVTQVIEATNNLHQATFGTTVQNCISIAGIEETNISSFSMYPNPTNGIVNIIPSKTLTGEITANVLDAIGRIVYTKKFTKNTTKLELDLQNCQKGIYQIQLTNGIELVNRALIIE